jgi:hypothetical protein
VTILPTREPRTAVRRWLNWRRTLPPAPAPAAPPAKR